MRLYKGVTHMEVLLQHLDPPLFRTLLQSKFSQLENDLNHLQRRRTTQVFIQHHARDLI